MAANAREAFSMWLNTHPGYIYEVFEAGYDAAIKSVEVAPSASANSANLAILLRKWAKWYISDQKDMPPFADTIDAVGSVAERQI